MEQINEHRAGGSEGTTISKDSVAELVVRITDWLDSDGAQLRTRQRQEIEEAHGIDIGPPITAETMPVFLVVESNGTPIACGGLRPLPDSEDAAEIKRMYVVPEFRGKSGVAGRLLRELEQHALLRGWTTLKLETGMDMAHARAFYQRHGYRETPIFAYYVQSDHSVCYEKTLAHPN